MVSRQIYALFACPAADLAREMSRYEKRLWRVHTLCFETTVTLQLVLGAFVQ